MKNILNEMSVYEKEQILRKHKGGKKVYVENFNKLVNNKLGSVNPLLVEQEDPNVKYLTDNGYKIVDKVSLPNGQYIYGGSGGVCYIYDKDGKTNTGYAVVMTYVIRGEWKKTPIEVKDGKFYDTSSKKDAEFKQILFKEAGYKPTQQTQTNSDQTQSLINKVATEGLKNILPAMIQSPPFVGYYSGYVISGTFNGVNYSWDLNGVDGMSGVRGLIDGVIETENNSFLSENFQITDANPKGTWVGFSDEGSNHFVCYQTTDNKIKCVNV